jgi:phosphosulfolactate phosphohydrolase-like enzyme
VDWIQNALSGFTTANATVNNGGEHAVQERSGTASLTAGVYYPIRIQFGEAGGGDVMTFNYSTPTITKTTNVTGRVFYNAATNGF